MIGKKGFFKIIEAVIAILLALLFLLYIIPFFHETLPNKTRIGLFTDMSNDDNFRNCAISENKTCLNKTIIKYNNKLDKLYDYMILLGNDSVNFGSLPEKDITAESYILAGNYTNYEPKIIKIIYWEINQ